MKRKLAILLMVTIIAGTFAACAPKEEGTPNSSPSEVQGQYTYKNGTYRAEMADFSKGWKEYVVLDIIDDKIEVKEYDAMSEADSTQLKSKDPGYREKMEENTGTYPEKFYPDIAAEFENAGQNIGNMETVAGATHSEDTFKRMVSELLAKNAVTGDNATLLLSKYVPGTYRVEQPMFDYGWKEYILVDFTENSYEVKEFDAYSEADKTKLKSKDEEYRKSMEEKSGTYPEKFYAELVEGLKSVENDIAKLETVAGATNATDSFKKLVTAAVSAAENGGKTEFAMNRYVDGEYKAEMQDFEHGWKNYVIITVKDDQVTIKEFDSTSEKDATLLQSKDEEYKASMEPKSGTYPEKFIKDIISAFDAANGDVTKMENIAGATNSANNFKLMMGELLAKNASTGNKEVLVVAPAPKA